MSIVSSEILRSVDLGGGSALVIERHTDSAGKTHEQRYVAASGVDTAAVLATHAIAMAAMLAELEAEGLLS